MACPLLLLGLCAAINFGAIWLEKGLGHPATGGWPARQLSDRRRAWWLQWATQLRTRHECSMVYILGYRFEIIG